MQYISHHSYLAQQIKARNWKPESKNPYIRGFEVKIRLNRQNLKAAMKDTFALQSKVMGWGFHDGQMRFITNEKFSAHLDAVVEVAAAFCPAPISKRLPEVIGGSYLHDVREHAKKRIGVLRERFYRYRFGGDTAQLRKFIDKELGQLFIEFAERYYPQHLLKGGNLGLRGIGKVLNDPLAPKRYANFARNKIHSVFGLRMDQLVYLLSRLTTPQRYLEGFLNSSALNNFKPDIQDEGAVIKAGDTISNNRTTSVNKKNIRHAWRTLRKGENIRPALVRLDRRQVYWMALDAMKDNRERIMLCRRPKSGSEPYLPTMKGMREDIMQGRRPRRSSLKKTGNVYRPTMG